MYGSTQDNPPALVPALDSNVSLEGGCQVETALLSHPVDDGDLKLQISSTTTYRNDGVITSHNVFRHLKDELYSPHTTADGYSKPRSYLLYWATLLAALGGLLFGYDMGVIAGTLFDLAEDLELSDVEQETVVSLLLAGAVVGSCIGGQLCDYLGRRITIMISCLFYVVGALTLAFAPTVKYLFAGRAIVGMGVALSSISDVLYIAELAPAHWRGAMVSLNELCITIGLLIAYLVNLAASWRWAFGASIVPAILQFCGMVYMPYSPRWLVMQGRIQQASVVLTRLQGIREADAELERIETSLARERESFPKKGVWHTARVLCSRSIRPRLFVGVMVTVFQQFSGHANVLYYAPIIFRRAGVGSNTAAILATAGLGGVKVLMTLISLCQVDTLGRRVLALGGAGSLLIATLTVAVGFHVNQVIVVAIGLTLYVASYAFGFGPLGWLLNSEIYPLHIRAPAIAVASITNWGCNLAVSMSFLSTMDAMGSAPTFYMYSAVALLSVVFLYFLLPETKGKSLEEVAIMFERHPRLSKMC